MACWMSLMRASFRSYAYYFSDSASASNYCYRPLHGVDCLLNMNHETMGADTNANHRSSWRHSGLQWHIATIEVWVRRHIATIEVWTRQNIKVIYEIDCMFYGTNGYWFAAIEYWPMEMRCMFSDCSYSLLVGRRQYLWYLLVDVYRRPTWEDGSFNRAERSSC